VSYSDAQYCQMLASVGQQSCASDNGRCPVATVRRNVYLEHRARNIERAQGRMLSLDLVDKESAEQAVREAWDLSGDCMDDDDTTDDRHPT
jgi:NADP-dependent 3-hydroxy acid dehydrogenase YdfG